MPKKITISDNESTESENSITEIEVKQPKPKKILSEKQKQALQKGREKIKERQAEKLLDKKIEASKLLLQEDYKNKIKEKKKPNKEEIEESDEEVIIIEKQRKPKKKVKRIIVQESSSESDSETSQPPEDDKISIPEKPMKSQRNKKSIITVHETPIVKPSKKIEYKNYFV